MRAVLALAGCLLTILPTLPAQDAAPAKVAVGKPAPDFTVTGIDGKPIKLSALTGKGKNVVLLFDRAHW